MTQNYKQARLLLSVLLIALGYSCKEQGGEEAVKELVQYEEAPSNLPLDRLTLPPGFKIEVYADSVDGARSMAMGDNGTLFVSTRNLKTV